jgi:hypothetical protein
VTTSKGGSGGVPTPAPAAGLTINLSNPQASEVDIGSRSCPAGDSGAFTYMLGMPAPNQTIEDGALGTTVDCTVTGGIVDAHLAGYNTTTKIRLEFSISGTPSKTSDSGVGDITFFSPETLTLSPLPDFPGCKLGPASVLKDGAVLTDFECPLLGAVDDTTSGCKAVGTVAFEYCKTQ